MRVSRTQAAENRQRVIEMAGRLFRERGFDGISVDDLMRAAGLTRGGFYKQFVSKDDLAVQASRRAIASGTRRAQRTLAAHPDRSIAALLDSYLTTTHRDHPGDGCALAALGQEAARGSPELRREFTLGVEEYIATVAEAVGDGKTPQPDGATAILAGMVGALVLSRAVSDPTLSARILDATKRELLSHLDDHAVSPQPIDPTDDR